VTDFAFYNDKTHTWDVESGEFIICNAASSANVKSKVTVSVK
jgi:beta-glucosidase